MEERSTSSPPQWPVLLHRCGYCREKSILIPCCKCFFDLLSIAFVIIIIHNGLPQRILPFCLTSELKCLCPEPCPPADCRKKEINTFLCLRLAILGDICKMNGLFYFVSSPPPLISIHKRIWHPDQTRGLFWDISLPTSWSAGSPNKVIFLASTPPFSDSLAFGAVSRESVDSATSGLHDGGTSDIAMVHAPLWAQECDENHDS